MRIEFTNKNLFTVQWKFGDKCNFNCPYCRIADKTGGLTDDQIAELVPNINKLFEIIHSATGKLINFHPTGGEPTLWDMERLLSSLDYTWLDTVSIITNGSASADYYKKLREACKCKLRIGVSYHEQADIEEWTAEKLQYADLIKVVISDGNEELYEKLAELSQKYPIQACIERDSSGKCLVTPEKLKLYKMFKFPSEPTIKVINDEKEEWYHVHEWTSLGNDCHFKGWECGAGLDKVSITPKGYIKRGSKCVGNEKLGNLKDITNFHLPTEPIICPTEICQVCSGAGYICNI